MDGLVGIDIEEIHRLPRKERKLALKRYHAWLKKQRKVDKAILNNLKYKLYLFKNPGKGAFYRRRYYAKIKSDPKRHEHFKKKQKQYQLKSKLKKIEEAKHGEDRTDS